jgi:hypothetical protein
MDADDGRSPVAVPARARRAGETRGQQPGVEPSVWTKRMLATLETGVRGGKWYSLMDKVHPEQTLQAAFARVEANDGAAGVDHVTVEMFEAELDANLRRLSEDLRTGEYRPQAIRRHYIPKPGSDEKRPLGIPTVRDRVVQTALQMVLEPIFERDFAAQSYGFRPGRGCKDALRRVDGLLRGWFAYFKHSYRTTFPSLDGWIRRRLRSLLRRRVHGKGIAKGRDQQRWPNRFFAAQGLFSLHVAYAAACQSPRG